uniref:Gamma-glutamyltranspeptidase 1-like n=1 Tax=Hirondellea gigas TaxID=1518452 RepID=A0A2P2I3X9_9CRUS
MAMTAQYISGGRRRLLLVGGAVVLLIVLAVGLGAGLRSSAEDDDGGATLTMPKPPTTPVSFREFEASINEGPGGRGWSSVGLSDSRLGEYGTAAVSSDGFPCAALAKGILLKNGTAADAAIAGLFCTGVVNTQSLGLGGGFLATYYDRATRTAYTLDAREVAPIAATRDMYKGNATKSFKGALSVAVPGEVHGYYALYRKFGGGLPWRDLLAPAIRLCEDGHPVNWHMAKALRKLNESTQAEPTMSVFLNPATGQVYKEGEILRRPALAATLRAIQDDPLTLYTGELNKKLLQDLKELGSIIQEEDFKNYAWVLMYLLYNSCSLSCSYKIT